MSLSNVWCRRAVVEFTPKQVRARAACIQMIGYRFDHSCTKMLVKGLKRTTNAHGAGDVTLGL